MHDNAGGRHAVEGPGAAAVTQALSECICSLGARYGMVLLHAGNIILAAFASYLPLMRRLNGLYDWVMG